MAYTLAITKYVFTRTNWGIAVCLSLSSHGCPCLVSVPLKCRHTLPERVLSQQKDEHWRKGKEPPVFFLSVCFSTEGLWHHSALNIISYFDVKSNKLIRLFPWALNVKCTFCDVPAWTFFYWLHVQAVSEVWHRNNLLKFQSQHLNYFFVLAQIQWKL